MSVFLTQNQLPLEAILDRYGKQSYLGNTFSLPTSGRIAFNQTEFPAAVIQNPASSTKSLFVFKQILYSSNNPALFKFYLNSSFSAGASTKPINLRTGSTTASVGTCYVGSISFTTSQGTLLTTLEASRTPVIANLLIVIDPGNTLLVSVTQTKSGSSTMNTQNIWYEI